MTRAMHPKVRAGVYARLRARLDRLERLLALDAPDVIVAAEVALVGTTAMWIDPHGIAEREGARHAAQARQAFGVCAECDADVAGPCVPFGDGLCATHAQQLAANLDLDDPTDKESADA